MKIKLPIFLLAIINIGCSSLYMPNLTNTPLLQEQNEFKCTLGLGDVQAAYAITENVGIIGNIGLRKENTRADTDLSQSNAQYEIGVGYFAKNRFGLQNEFYGGFGGINMKRTNTDFTFDRKVIDEFKISGVKLFAQYNVGYATPQMDIIFSTRLVGLKFGTPTTSLSQDLQDIYQYTGVESKMWGFIEPAITVTKGFGPAKIFTQVGKSMLLSQGKIGFEPNIFKFGVTLNMGSWYKFWKDKKNDDTRKLIPSAPPTYLNKSTVSLPSTVYKSEHSRFTRTPAAATPAANSNALPTQVVSQQKYYNSVADAEAARASNGVDLNQRKMFISESSNPTYNQAGNRSDATPKIPPGTFGDYKPAIPAKSNDLNRGFMLFKRIKKYTKNNW